MPSRLGRWSEGLMEACWLAAVIVVPTFFNVYSSRIFEPDKLALLRTLALVSAAAWGIKIVSSGNLGLERLPGIGTPWQRFLRLPIIPWVAVLLLVSLISTLFSLTPRISFWGSYQRMQGTFTMLSYLVIFATLVAHLRRRDQVERLFTVVILTSLPVSLYGVLQRYQFDPIPWGGDVSTRIAANMGNSIFVAAYLILALPMTMMRALGAFAAILNADMTALGRHFARSTVYVFIASLQLIALFLSGSRGPMLGWLAGSFFLFVLLSLHISGRAGEQGIVFGRWVTLVVIGMSGVLGGFLILLNIPGGPLDGLRGTEGLGRLGRVFETEGGTGRVRALIWQGAAELVGPHEPLVYPDDRPDRFHALRPLVGYGPESMHVAFNRFFPPELAQLEQLNASPDRAHNETWDALVTTGVLGFAAYQALFASIFYYGLKWLGLVADGRQRRRFFALYVGGGLAAAAGLMLWKGVGFLGVGLPFGAVLGLIAYLAWVALASPVDLPSLTATGGRSLVLVALLAALVGHFVEIHFGIAIAVTRLYFWVFTGLLLVVGRFIPEEDLLPAAGAVETQADSSPEPPAAHSRRAARRRRSTKVSTSGGLDFARFRPGLVNALLIGLLLTTLGYDYLNAQPGDLTVWGSLWSSITRLPNQGGALSYWVLILILLTWLASGVALTTDAGSSDEGMNWRLLGETLGLSALLGFVFGVWHSAWLVNLARLALEQRLDLLTQVALLEGVLVRYYVYLLILVGLLALVLPIAWPARRMDRPAVGILAVPVLLALALGLGYVANVRAIQADIDYKLADPFARNGQWPAAIALYTRAVDTMPSEDFYYLFLGKTYLDSVQGAQPGLEQQARLEEAERYLLEALELNPLNPDHTANLARLYRWWAANLATGPDQLSLVNRADQYYRQSITLSPNNVGLWGEWAALAISVLDQPEAALSRLEHAIGMNPTYHPNQALLGDYFVQASRRSTDLAERQRALASAATQYRTAIENASGEAGPVLLSYHLALGAVLVELDRYPEAILVYEAILPQAASASDAWRIFETLASLYYRIGDTDRALFLADQALNLAPEPEQARIQTFIEDLHSVP